MAQQRTIEAEALSSRTWFRALMGVDMLVQLGGLVWLMLGFETASRLSGLWVAIALGVTLVVGIVSSLFSIGLLAKAMTWRRRSALLLIVLVLWRGAVWEVRGLQVAVTLWGTLIWLALLIEGKRVARAVAEATGEEVLSLDPLNPDR